MRVNDAKQGTLFIENILIALWAGCLFGTLHSVWALMIFLDTPPKPPSPPSTQTFFYLPPPIPPRRAVGHRRRGHLFSQPDCYHYFNIETTWNKREPAINER